MNTSQDLDLNQLRTLVTMLDKEEIRFPNLVIDPENDFWTYKGTIIKNLMVLRGLLEAEMLNLIMRKVWYITIAEGIDANAVTGEGVKIEYGSPDRSYYGKDLFDVCYKILTNEI